LQEKPAPAHTCSSVSGFMSIKADVASARLQMIDFFGEAPSAYPLLQGKPTVSGIRSRLS
jgi:hypothetical protein